MSKTDENSSRSATIDRNSPIPLYQQIKQILIEELMNSKDTNGLPFSTEKELVERFNVSRAPVRQALRELENEGYVYRERAKGTFPVKGAPVRPPGLELGGLLDYLKEQGMEANSRILSTGHEIPPQYIADFLGIKKQEKVFRVSRLVLFEESPLVWTQTYMNVPKSFNPTREYLEEAGSVFHILERDQGITVSQGENEIWATGARQEEAEILNVKEGDPILVMETKLFTRQGQKIGWRRAVHKADVYKYSFTSMRNN